MSNKTLSVLAIIGTGVIAGLIACLLILGNDMVRMQEQLERHLVCCEYFMPEFWDKCEEALPDETK